MNFSYCCDTPQGEELSVGRHVAKRQHLCVRCHSTYKYTMMSRQSSSRVVAEAIEMQRRIIELQQKTTSLAERGSSIRQWKAMADMCSLLARQSLTRHLLVLKEIRGVKVFRRLVWFNNCPSTRFIAIQEVYLESEERLSPMKLPQLKACNGIVPHTEEKYPVSGSHVGFAEK